MNLEIMPQATPMVALTGDTDLLGAQVIEGTPADETGLEEGDRVFSVPEFGFKRN